MRNCYYSKEAARIDAEYFGGMCRGFLLTLHDAKDARTFDMMAGEARHYAENAAHAARVVSGETLTNPWSYMGTR